MIGILNYGVGNLRSVYNAFEYLKYKVFYISKIDDFKKAKGIVIPGVGHFKRGMSNLNQKNFVEELNYHILEKSIPCLGICLGMQLMSEIGLEGSETKGLGWFPATVEKIDSGIEAFDLRIPHVGWNEITITESSSQLFKGMNRPTFYFVHSYFVNLHSEENNERYRTSYTEYGREITASIERDNIFAVQFHPEKSQQDGIRLLSNFLEMVGNG